jgi:hypothetical protein
VYGKPGYGTVTSALKAELRRLRREVGDERTPWVAQ